MKQEKLKNRIVSEQQCMKRIMNVDLTCKDCVYRYDDSVKFGNTSTCEMNENKPNKVLLGDKCDEYENE